MTYFRKIKYSDKTLLASIRIAVGLIWIFSGFSKIADPTFNLMKTAQYLASSNPYMFYQTFINSFVIPNSGLFQVLIPYGELAIGLMLVLGLYTRLPASFGILFNINFFLAASWTGSSTAILNLLMILLQAIFFSTTLNIRQLRKI